MKIICEAVLGYFDIVNIISGAVEESDTSDISWPLAHLAHWRPLSFGHQCHCANEMNLAHKQFLIRVILSLQLFRRVYMLESNECLTTIR